MLEAFFLKAEKLNPENPVHRIPATEEGSEEDMTDRIKICPHCGADAYLQANYSYKTRSFFVMCKCELCGAQGKIFNSKENPESEGWDSPACNSAIKAWNMRIQEAG